MGLSWIENNVGLARPARAKKYAYTLRTLAQAQLSPGGTKHCLSMVPSYKFVNKSLTSRSNIYL